MPNISERIGEISSQSFQKEMRLPVGTSGGSVVSAAGAVGSGAKTKYKIRKVFLTASCTACFPPHTLLRRSDDGKCSCS